MCFLFLPTFPPQFLAVLQWRHAQVGTAVFAEEREVGEVQQVGNQLRDNNSLPEIQWVKVQSKLKQVYQKKMDSAEFLHDMAMGRAGNKLIFRPIIRLSRK